MKKTIYMLFILIILSGCKQNTKEKEDDKKVLSKGDLVCAYKLRTTSENTIYTSYYEYNFNDNGILKGAKNVESIEFENSSDEVKENYKKEIEEIIKEYDDIDGIEVTTKYEDNKYSFTVVMDNSKMDEETISKFTLDEDRVGLYNQYTDAGYTCE